MYDIDLQNTLFRTSPVPATTVPHGDGDSNEHSCQSERTNIIPSAGSDSNRQTPIHQDESAEDYVVYDPDVYIKDEIDERKKVSREIFRAVIVGGGEKVAVIRIYDIR